MYLRLLPKVGLEYLPNMVYKVVDVASLNFIEAIGSNGKQICEWNAVTNMMNE